MSVAYNSTLANTIITKWDMDVLEARYANGVILNRVLSKSDLVTKMGDTITINIEPTLSTGTVTAATGAFTASANATSKVNLSVNIWEYVADTITDQARVQSFWTAENLYPKQAGKAWAARFDTVIGGKYSGLSYEVGNDTAPEDFSPENARLALLKLADANVPLVNLSWILPPIGIYMGWMKSDVLTAANSMGVAKNVNTTGYVSPILGHPAYLSTVLSQNTTKTAYKGMLLHKEAIAIAFQKNNEYKLVDNAPAGALTHTALTHSLYGCVNVRDHGVIINVKAS